uniref:C2H2-type domain-containing protein n=1 Tax=Plectus sambesii TaxID=2011161 RepID=A0A914WXU9_9BILA
MMREAQLRWAEKRCVRGRARGDGVRRTGGTNERRTLAPITCLPGPGRRAAVYVATTGAAHFSRRHFFRRASARPVLSRAPPLPAVVFLNCPSPYGGGRWSAVGCCSEGDARMLALLIIADASSRRLLVGATSVVSDEGFGLRRRRSRVAFILSGGARLYGRFDVRDWILALDSYERSTLQAFDSKAELHVHTQMHMREAKPYKCTHCVKSFANSSYLSQHMRIHLGIKPFGPCQYCGKKFTQLSHLQQHIRTHTGEKPYKCKYPGCEKAFSQLSNLQSHSRCHQSDKPYKCNSCYKCFTDEQALLDHIPKHKESKHLKVHICPYCGKSYTQATYLAKHMTKHADRRDRDSRLR